MSNISCLKILRCDDVPYLFHYSTERLSILYKSLEAISSDYESLWRTFDKLICHKNLNNENESKCCSPNSTACFLLTSLKSNMKNTKVFLSH